MSAVLNETTRVKLPVVLVITGLFTVASAAVSAGITYESLKSRLDTGEASDRETLRRVSAAEQDIIKLREDLNKSLSVIAESTTAIKVSIGKLDERTQLMLQRSTQHKE